MRTSSKSGFRGIRKVGTCLGSWSCCNDECSFLKTEKVRNTCHFIYKAGSRMCYSCGQFAAQAPCGARKLIQHSFGSDHTYVYHFGYHSCDLKQEVSNDREFTKKWVDRYPGLSFRNLKTTVVQTLLDDRDALGAQVAAIVLQFAVDMNQDGPQNILQDEDVYFDGCHSRCKDYISFGLWFRHPSMRRVVKLAGMETRKEDTEAIALFFSKLNEMLQQITRNPHYTFNPKNIMMDEAGANFAGIARVFGQDFVDKKCITCQWHFLTNMHEHKFEIDEKFRDDF